MKKPSSIILSLFMVTSLLMSGVALAEEDDDNIGVHYFVTITNITRGQVITPPLVASHNNEFRLFKVGEPAIPELVALAEDGPTGDLLTLLGSLDSVYDSTAATGPLLPGESVTLEIRATKKFGKIAAVGMLATTNDAFFGIQGVRVPKKYGKTVYAPAYDAGSETNSELCSTIPGPPCSSPFVRNTANAEGYVHIHAGVHGIGDLDPSRKDWRNPVAKITLQRAN